MAWEDHRLIDIMLKPEEILPSMAALCNEFQDLPEALAYPQLRQPFVQVTFKWAAIPQQIKVIWLRRLPATAVASAPALRRIRSTPRYCAE